MTTGILGGLFMIVGCAFTWRGNIYKALCAYALADTCWLAQTYAIGDTFGFITVMIATGVSAAVAYKMHSGVFYKTVFK